MPALLMNVITTGRVIRMSKRVTNEIVVDGVNFISKEQFYRMCKISKHTAKLLLDYKIVPPINTNKLTRCYKIAMADAMDFLDNKEARLKKIPAHARRSRAKKKKIRLFYNSYDFSSDEIKSVNGFLSSRFKQYPDMLSSAQASQITGLAKSTVVKMIKKGHIVAISIKMKYLVSKQSLVEFIISKNFYSLTSYSTEFNDLLKEIFLHLDRPITTTDAREKSLINSNTGEDCIKCAK
jgi:hypothetical protein